MININQAIIRSKLVAKTLRIKKKKLRSKKELSQF